MVSVVADKHCLASLFIPPPPRMIKSINHGQTEGLDMKPQVANWGLYLNFADSKNFCHPEHIFHVYLIMEISPERNCAFICKNQTEGQNVCKHSVRLVLIHIDLCHALCGTTLISNIS